MRKNVALMLVLIFLTASCSILAKPAWPSTQIAENSWTTKAPMHTARAYLGVAVINGKIFAIGGDVASLGGNLAPGIAYSNQVVDTTEEYDPSTDMWVTKTSMPTARAFFGTAVYQNKIYCIGGYNDQPATRTNEVYDPTSDTWETKSPTPTAVFGVQANTVGDKIYVIGGDSNVNYVYDPDSDSWLNKTSSPYRITSSVSAVIDNKIFFISGLPNPSGYLPSQGVIQEYDVLSDIWSTVAASPSIDMSGNGGGATSGAGTERKIYFFDDPDTNVFDPESESWTLGVSMPSNRLCAGVAVVNDVFYVIGGRSGTHGYITMLTPSNIVEEYVPFGYGMLPVVCIVSLENKTYSKSSVPLTFTVDKPVLWTEYSLDGQDNVTIEGNTTLTNLLNGLHNVTVYAKYTEGSIGASENIVFSIDAPEPFPTVPVAVASGASIAAVSVGLLVYFKKRKRGGVGQE
jgi:N-acetylneuraminic acid mutarotase